ncbi:MAG TPA: alpha-L-fucosidase [Bryobacteraceae bacterium]|nr:alpha-L-fucosidase [Bryobacteraceae bacterium]
MTRRDYLQILGAGAALAGASQIAAAAPAGESDRERRMKWWHEARFGMFIHWGLYSTLGRHEWVMENEGIPVAEYEQYAKTFKPKPNAARAWAKLAKQAGQKYMVMTTKHHEGFCLFDSKLTNYCAPKQGPGRDLVAEYVEAARAEGRRVGFYYSLMDWHHPDGARCATDEQARRRFVDYIHGQIHELLTNYGKIDVLWYDVAWPLDARGWESEKMNEMVFKLQPDIIVNNRNKLDGDFATPEQRIQAEKRAWESCMTMNGSWGYHKTDDDWKTPKTVIRNLITCSRDTGNYLLNIGPKPDGSIPDESVRIMTAVGKWMDKNGQSIYDTDPCQPRRSNYASFTRKGNTLYMHIHFWPGSTAVISGLMNQVKSARLLASGQEVKFEQDRFRVRFVNLPANPPDDPITTIAIECDGEPKEDNEFVRRERPRSAV